MHEDFIDKKKKKHVILLRYHQRGSNGRIFKLCDAWAVKFVYDSAYWRDAFWHDAGVAAYGKKNSGVDCFLYSRAFNDTAYILGTRKVAAWNEHI